MSSNNNTAKTKGYESPPQGIPLLLLSSMYVGDERAIYLRFYDLESQRIFFWKDNTEHKPYCYVQIEDEHKVDEIIQNRSGIEKRIVKKHDPMQDKEIEILKVTAPDPLSIGGTDESIREKVKSWEADIKYHENFLFDLGLIPGSYYRIVDGKLVDYSFPIPEKVDNYLNKYVLNVHGQNDNNKEYSRYLKNWAHLLNQPIPDLKRISLDIEVESEEGHMPTPRDHDKPITAIGFVSNDGFKKVLLLNKDNQDVSSVNIPDSEIFNSEKDLLSRAFDIIKSYPIVLTYNGDDFDLPYIYARALDSSIDPVTQKPFLREEIPIVVKRDSFIKRGLQAEPVQIKNGVHIDLFRAFQNRSFQIYAFSHKYSEFTLNAISEALLGEGKFEFEGSISDLPLERLAQYCLKDADLTFRLSSFNDNLLMKLLVVISRIGRLSIDDISRFGVNQWIRGMLYFEHRRLNYLIPRKDDLREKGTSSTTAIIKEKKYRGGLVVEPVLGIHFKVIVVDFASLYPSIIKVHNLSYETVNCPHNECKSDPSCQIEGTKHWICKKNKGITSLLIGSLRDLRVNYYKHLSKDKSISAEERNLYNVVSQAIKVILNASYGVMGAEIFPLYCLPVADATAALGRVTTGKAIERCQALGIQVTYGDTDSLFLKNATDGQLRNISEWAKSTLGVDLEIDKEYRYVVFSDLKKNYLGVMADGTVDVKGLTGKKSHTPSFIRSAFYKILDILKEVYSENDFEFAKEKIKNTIITNVRDLQSKNIPLEELSFNVMINKSPDKYGKTTTDRATSLDGKGKEIYDKKGIPQHIKAAHLLVNVGSKLKAGDIISYVKTKTNGGVKPVQLAKADEIDTEKYLETMESTFDQLLSSLNLNFKSLVGKPRQANLDELFWAK